MPAARASFEDLAANTRGSAGITRPPYGEGEQYAYRLMDDHASILGLKREWDAAGNLYMTLPGTDAKAPAIVIGSHLDSVPNGGNFDGAAGVIAGLAVLEAYARAGFRPRCDVRVMAIRAEEAGSWFTGEHGGHLGSRMALGLIAPTELDTAVRLDSGRTLGQHIADCGFDPARVKSGPAYLNARRIRSYFELHIEQGPVLEMKELAVGVVNSIRGNSRLRDARCLGAYNHGGATPQEVRRDAVIATSELILGVDRKWSELHAAGADLIFTFGKVSTDPAVHSLSKVPGEMRFSLDIRSGSPDVLTTMRAFVSAEAERVGAKRQVRFELGEFSLSQPTVLDASLCATLHAGCAAVGMPTLEMASGGGHDAQEFTRAGIPSAMIFVRNANGSHVADEGMEMSDFEAGTKLLAWAVAATAGEG
jgi:N-carbamoyl-L-amino-acid hydrolase